MKDVGSKVIATLIAAAILGLVTFILPGGWGTIFHAISKIWAWLGDTVGVKAWLLCLLTLLSLATVCGIFIFFVLTAENKGAGARQELPEIVFGRVRWRSMDAWINNVLPFCADCDLQLHPRHSRIGVLGSEGPVSYHCEKCGEEKLREEVNHDRLVDRVKREMQLMLRESDRRANDER